MESKSLLPNRISKPRTSGITMVIDGGMSVREVEDMLEVASDYIDYVKLGWGTSLVVQNLEEKIKKLQDNNIPVCLGGTFFEFFLRKERLDLYDDILKKYNISMVEISDGTLEMERSDKLDYISKYAKDYQVNSEFGSKKVETIYAPSLWVKSMKEELEAGAKMVIAEGRESGKAGVFRDSSEIRTGLVDDIVNEIPSEKILWEAPQKQQQVWFIKKFGTNVNLGNINPRGVIGLETLRVGLRGDTLLTFH